MWGSEEISASPVSILPLQSGEAWRPGKSTFHIEKRRADIVRVSATEGFRRKAGFASSTSTGSPSIGPGDARSEFWSQLKSRHFADIGCLDAIMPQWQTR